MTAHLDDTQVLLTAEEVARLLRVKPTTIYEAAAKGRLPSVRLWEGRRKALVRFRREDVLQFIQDRRREARSKP